MVPAEYRFHSGIENRCHCHFSVMAEQWWPFWCLPEWNRCHCHFSVMAEQWWPFWCLQSHVFIACGDKWWRRPSGSPTVYMASQAELIPGSRAPPRHRCFSVDNNSCWRTCDTGQWAWEGCAACLAPSKCAVGTTLCQLLYLQRQLSDTSKSCVRSQHWRNHISPDFPLQSRVLPAGRESGTVSAA